MIRRILVLADTHFGSRAGLFPESYTHPDGVVIQPSRGLADLYDSFRAFMRLPDVRKCDTWLLLGDIVQGNNRKEFGRILTVGELESQVELAVNTLKPYCKNKTIMGVAGSRYHNSLDMSLDNLVISQLGGEWLGIEGYVKLKGTDRVIYAVHSLGQGMLYQAASLDRVGIWLDVAEGRGKFEQHVDLLVCAHRHTYLLLQDTSRTLLQVPCWQARLPWEVLAQNPGRSQPDIGGCVVEVSDECGVVVKHFGYSSPRIFDGMRAA